MFSLCVWSEVVKRQALEVQLLILYPSRVCVRVCVRACVRACVCVCVSEGVEGCVCGGGGGGGRADRSYLWKKPVEQAVQTLKCLILAQQRHMSHLLSVWRVAKSTTSSEYVLTRHWHLEWKLGIQPARLDQCLESRRFHLLLNLTAVVTPEVCTMKYFWFCFLFCFVAVFRFSLLSLFGWY